MFTIEQINDLHDRLGDMETVPEYLRALRAIGVDRFDSYLRDGHSEYFDREGQCVVSGAAHELLTIADVADQDKEVEHLGRHQRGEIDYVEMSKGLAANGVDKWTMDTDNLTVTYLDKQGNSVLIETLQ